MYAMPTESRGIEGTSHSFPVSVWDDHDGMILSVVFGNQEDFSYLASGGSDYAIVVYRVKNGECQLYWKEENAHNGYS